MRALFNYVTILSAIVLITTILLQSQGTSLGGAFGGSDGGGYRTRRGAERMVFYATIGSAVVFIVAVILGILSKR